MGEEVGARCEMELKSEKLAKNPKARVGEGRTNRAFWRHWTTSDGRVLVVWRLIVPAEAS